MPISTALGSSRSPRSGRPNPGRRVRVAGLITHRQRPGTALGITFLNLEDETGIVNVICSQGVMRAHRQAARNRVAVIIRGKVERNYGVVNLVADQGLPLDVLVPAPGRRSRSGRRHETSGDAPSRWSQLNSSQLTASHAPSTNISS